MKSVYVMLSLLSLHRFVPVLISIILLAKLLKYWVSLKEYPRWMSNSPNLLKSIYCAFFKPIIECSSVVWDPQPADTSKQFKRIRWKFLNFAKHYNNSILHFLDLSSSADRRHSNNFSILHKHLSASIEYHSFLPLINLKVSIQSTRNTNGNINFFSFLVAL